MKANNLLKSLKESQFVSALKTALNKISQPGSDLDLNRWIEIEGIEVRYNQRQRNLKAWSSIEFRQGGR